MKSRTETQKLVDVLVASLNDVNIHEELVSGLSSYFPESVSKDVVNTLYFFLGMEDARLPEEVLSAKADAISRGTAVITEDQNNSGVGDLNDPLLASTHQYDAFYASRKVEDLPEHVELGPKPCFSSSEPELNKSLTKPCFKVHRDNCSLPEKDRLGLKLEGSLAHVAGSVLRRFAKRVL
jgi:hypothetical protein